MWLACRSRGWHGNRELEIFAEIEGDRNAHARTVGVRPHNRRPARRRLRAGDDRGNGSRHVGRGAAWCDGRGRQSGADRESPHRRDRQHRPVSDRQPAPRSLHGHFFADRLRHRPSRRHRTDGRQRGHHQRRAPGRLARGNDHRQRRGADRGRAERVAQQRDELGHAGRGAGDPRLQRAGVPGPVGHRRQQSGGLEPDDAHLLQPRRPRQRRPRDGGRAERRRGAERRRRVALRAGYHQQPGDDDEPVRRSR